MNEGGTHVDGRNLAITAGQFCRSVNERTAGLAIGKIKLADGSEVLGVLAENWLTEGQREITSELGSWRKYTGIFILCNAHL